MDTTNDKLTDIKINAELIKDAVKRMRTNKGYGQDFNQEFNNCLSEIGFNSVDDVLSKPLSFNLKSGFGAMEKEIRNVETFYKDLVRDINSYKSGCGESDSYKKQIMKVKEELYDAFNNYRTKGTRNKKTMKMSKLTDEYKTKQTSKANLISYMTNDLKKKKPVAKKAVSKKMTTVKKVVKKSVSKKPTSKKPAAKKSTKPMRILFQSELTKKRVAKKKTTSKSHKRMIY